MSESLLAGGAIAFAAGTVVTPLQTMNLRVQLRMDKSPQASVQQGRALYKGYFWRCGRYVPVKLVDNFCQDRIPSFITNIPCAGRDVVINMIQSTLCIALTYPIDSKIIRLVRDMDNVDKDEQNSDEEFSAIAMLSKMYTGALPAFGRMVVSHFVYSALYVVMNRVLKLLPIRITNFQEIVLRAGLYLGSDLLSYPLGAVSRIQVAEDLSLQDAVKKCSEEGLFYHGYTFNATISFVMVVCSVAVTGLRAALMETGEVLVKTK